MILNHNCCIKWVLLVIFIEETRSHIHQIYQQIFYFLAPVHVQSYAGRDNRCSSGIVGSTPTRQRYYCTCL
jgi:hypothetical protein